MDTLILSSCVFLIPINLAAIRQCYLTMNILTVLLATSWAHHALAHIKGAHSSVYDTVDKTMCGVATVYSAWYTYWYLGGVRQAVYCVCLGGVFFAYSRVRVNKWYYTRGLVHWKKHRFHVLMHVSATIGFVVMMI